jgi:glutamate carboxypeptidase
LADLAELVSIDSPSSDKQGTDRLGRLLAARLADVGCAVEVTPSALYGDTVMGTLHGHGRARLLLIGHLDTVYPAGTAAARPFTLRDGRAYGPGTADMKGGVLVGLYALSVLAALPRRPFAALSLLLNADEEVGSPGSAGVIATQSAGADAVLVLEAARASGALVSARKGVGTYRLTVEGRAAHAGANPDQGRNAIVELCHKLVAIDALNGRWPGVTVTVGTIEGGTVTNVVPDAARAAIDARAPDEAGAAALEQALRAIADQVIVEGTRTSLAGGWLHPPMPCRPGTTALLALARRAATELGFAVADVTSGGASDANRPSALGIPTLDGLGPIGAGAHSPHEHIVIGSIVPRTALLARLIALCDDEWLVTSDQ